jgi:hypothetical protein
VLLALGMGGAALLNDLPDGHDLVVATGADIVSDPTKSLGHLGTGERIEHKTGE